MSALNSSVAEYYGGKSIFITGGTGFLGKILIEKLLYSCPNVGNIYILIREKKGRSPEERLREFLNSTVFNRVKADCPDNLKKIVVVKGDITEFELGLNSKDLHILQEKISVVFHFAATLRFNEPLSVAMKVNFAGTEEVLRISHSMKNIEVFVYMSTIFSNTDHERSTIIEELYPSPKHVDEVYKMILENDPNECFNPKLLDSTVFLGITLDSDLQWNSHLSSLVSRMSSAGFAVRKVRQLTDVDTARLYYFSNFFSTLIYGILLWGERPNTYTFSKAMAENLVADSRGALPTIIIRPSIVTSCINEPMQGWIANWMGPTPIVTLFGKGLIRCLYGKSHYNFEIIPADYVVNLTLIAVAKHDRSKELKIYHSCSTADNPLTLGHISKYVAMESVKQKFNDIPYPAMIITTSNWLLCLLQFLLHTCPAYIADFLLFITGRRPRYIEMLRKMTVCMSILKYFSSKSWSMKATQTRQLIDTLSEIDKRHFPCDPRNINWKEYSAIYFNGIRKYLLKLE